MKGNDMMGYPSKSTWGIFYTRWFDRLVDSLGEKFSQADREDAVTQAFVKLMGKSEEEYGGDAPHSEWEWYANLWWQSKAVLSHLAESRDTWKRHHKQATMEGYLTSSVPRYDSFDIEIRNAALRSTLNELCREAGMKEVNVRAYIRWYLEGEPSDEVANDLHTTPGNLYTIRHRIEKLLGEKGKERYRAIRRRLFLEAA